MPSRMEASSPIHILDAVSKVADQLLLKKEEGGGGGRGLVFLCGEFGKSNIAAPKKKMASKKGGTSKSRRDSMRKKNAKFGGSGGTAGTASSSGGGSGTASANALSARAACTMLNEKGIRAEPLHVALGLEGNDDDSVKVRPGTVVSFCTAGQFKELGKWTKQVGG